MCYFKKDFEGKKQKFLDDPGLVVSGAGFALIEALELKNQTSAIHNDKLLP